MLAAASSLPLIAGLALVFSVVALITRNERGRDATTFTGMLADGFLFRLGLVALSVACIAGVLRMLSRRLIRHASTPLPPTPADPLATYRDGPPAECPRHPFAR
jgi:hypothetical protein